MLSFSKFLRITMLGMGMATTATSTELGNISFIGDSITQGGGDTVANANSYRYSLWKCFVDNKVTYAPVGSMTIYLDGKKENSKAPNYMGQTFNNTSEGHYGWKTNGLLNGLPSAEIPKRPNTGSGKASDWIETLQANDKVPDTITFMIGINDLASKINPSQMLADLGKVIEAYQGANPNVTVHVFSVLPTNQTWQTQAGYTSSDAYNTMLKDKVGEWNTGNSKVVYNDVSAGFSPVSHTSDNIHPNEQGNLIIAGNMARALGLEQRTMGLERKGASDLTAQISFPTVSGSAPTQKDNKVSIGGNTAANWTFSSATMATLAATGKKTTSWLEGSWETKGGEFTLDFSLSLQSKNDAAQYFTAWIGNGVSQDGMLKIFENKVLWGHKAGTETVLYEANMTGAFHDFRIVYMNASEGGSTAGYSIWLDGQLIGEGLQGDVSYNNDRFLLGTYTGDATCYADVKNIAYDNKKAYAPSSASVPEPGVSMLTLAGLGILAFRRRKA